MRIVVTEVTGQGSIRRGVLDTDGHSEADRCQDLVERAGLDAPPPYRPVVGRPVYEICVDGKAFWVGWRELAGPLQELVMIILTGRPASGPGERPVDREHAGLDAPGEAGSAQPEDVPARRSPSQEDVKAATSRPGQVIQR